MSLGGIVKDMRITLGVHYLKLLNLILDDRTIYLVVLVPLAPSLDTLAENCALDFAIRKCGVFLLPLNITRQVAEQSFCGGGVVTAFGIPPMLVAKGSMRFSYAHSHEYHVPLRYQGG